MSMGDTIKLNDQILTIVEVSKLVEKFGIPAIQHALNYLAQYPKVLKHRYADSYGFEWFLSDEDDKRVRNSYGYIAPFNKISAIKLFREITGCDLKEAKDAIESKFNCRPNY